METNDCKTCLAEHDKQCLKEAKDERKKMPGSILNYQQISKLIIASVVVNSFIIILANIPCIYNYLVDGIGILKYEVLIQFFFGSLGAAITCSLFLSRDMEINALESVKEKPDLSTLRYPNIMNVHLYFHRLITSGILAVLGAFLLLAGFAYIDFDYTDFSTKHKILFAISSMLIGLYQHKFMKIINEVFDKFYKSEKNDDPKNKADKNTNDGVMNDIGK